MFSSAGSSGFTCSSACQLTIEVEAVVEPLDASPRRPRRRTSSYAPSGAGFELARARCRYRRRCIRRSAGTAASTGRPLPEPTSRIETLGPRSGARERLESVEPPLAVPPAPWRATVRSVAEPASTRVRGHPARALVRAARAERAPGSCGGSAGCRPTATSSVRRGSRASSSPRTGCRCGRAPARGR